MQLTNESIKYLLPAKKPGKFYTDEYDIDVADLMKNWKEIDKADVGIVGVPFDTSVLLRRGCRFGPDGIRDALIFSTSYEPGLGVDLSEDFVITDFGNIEPKYTDVLETHRRIEIVLTDICSQGITPLVLGGDHGISYPTIKSLMNNVGKVGVIMIDAHTDLRKSHHYGEISSGTPFRRLIDEPKRNPLDPKNLVEIGINGWHNTKYYLDYAKEQGITVITAREVHKRGIEDVVLQALEIASKDVDAIWLSFDIDGLDFAAAPGTCAPNPGGLSAQQGLEAVWLIGQHEKCRGMDLLEVSPPLDINSLTSQMGAALAMQFLGATKRRFEKYGRG